MTCTNPGLDLWEGCYTPVAEGLHRLTVTAWVDRFGSWRSAIERKASVGQDTAVDREVGVQMIESAARLASPKEAGLLVASATAIRGGDLTRLDTIAPLMTEFLESGLFVDVSTDIVVGSDPATGEPLDVLVERERALFGSWYELFPRSFGTLRQVAEQVDYVADMGFDVLYLPPIHPIGTTHRKGPSNSASAGPDDPGSPWAIGGVGGGHTSIHPDLGNFADFEYLVDALGARSMELALDLALQCSPDHPWVHDHPEWFRHRPDGSIQYAENPPKRYEDIYPLDFECDEWQELWNEILGVVRFWIARGVRIFRVDNPHTKPFPFWQWLISEVRRTDPDVIWLAEAFTRPRVMHTLAQLGFTQSYTYFTWRVSKWDLREYFEELSSAPSVDEFRPNAWPNTPDILPWHLQDAPPTMNALRLMLAATLSASYGIYGPVFELAENSPAGNGKEEYGSSEKYELRNWDIESPMGLGPLITKVNAIRHGQMALRTNRTLCFHEIGNDDLICYSKTTHDGPDPDPSRPERNPVFVAVNLDPSEVNSEIVTLDLNAIGIDPSRPFEAHDLMDDHRYTWHGPQAFIKLDPAVAPGHIMRISQPPRS